MPNRRPDAEKCGYQRIKEIVATPRKPNPKDPTQREPQPERQTKGVEVGGDGSNGRGLGFPQAQEGIHRDVLAVLGAV